MCLATRRAPSSSPSATAGATGVTARARSPSASYASAATTDESTPPLNATTALSSCSSMRRRHRLRPDDLHGRVGDPRGALAIGVLGRDVDDLPVQPPEL